MFKVALNFCELFSSFEAFFNFFVENLKNRMSFNHVFFVLDSANLPKTPKKFGATDIEEIWII